MSKDTPEVGDVWQYKTDDKHKIHIVSKHRCYPLDGKFRSIDECQNFECVHRCNSRKELETSNYLFEDIIEYYTIQSHLACHQLKNAGCEYSRGCK